MILRLEVPHLDTNFPAGSVAKWYVRDGQKVSYGDPLCDLSVEDRLILRGAQGAHRLVRIAGEGWRRTSKRDVKRGEVLVTYRLIASEPGTLRRIFASEGARVQTGDLLGLVTFDQEEPLEASQELLEEAPSMRVIARVLEEQPE